MILIVQYVVSNTQQFKYDRKPKPGPDETREV